MPRPRQLEDQLQTELELTRRAHGCSDLSCSRNWISVVAVDHCLIRFPKVGPIQYVEEIRAEFHAASLGYGQGKILPQAEIELGETRTRQDVSAEIAVNAGRRPDEA